MNSVISDLFGCIWNIVEETVMKNYNVENDTKSTVSEKDAMFMLLTFLKDGEDWHFLAKILECKGSNIHKSNF